MHRTRLSWAVAATAALWISMALGATAMMNEVPGALVLPFVSFATPFGVGLLAQRRQRQLSIAGFGGGVIAGLLPGALLITIANQLFPGQAAPVLLTLPVVFAASVGGAYLGSGWTIPPREHDAEQEPEATRGVPGGARALTREGLEQILAFERRTTLVMLGLSFALLFFLFGRSGLLEQDVTFVGVMLLFVLVLVLVAVSVRGQLRQKRTAWESLRIALDENALSPDASRVCPISRYLFERSRAYRKELWGSPFAGEIGMPSYSFRRVWTATPMYAGPWRRLVTSSP